MARTLERQSGKTTLVQATFPDKPCVSLDARLFFWRDKIGREVDLLVEHGSQPQVVSQMLSPDVY